VNIDNTLPLRLGAFSGSNTTSNNFAGEMDDVAIWNRVLTQSEIQTCMNEMSLGCEQDLFLLYDFDDNSTANKTGKGFDGSAFGATFIQNGLNVTFTAEVDATFEGTLPLAAAVEIGITEQPSHGELIIDQFTGEFTYIPDGDDTVVSDSFKYIVYDENDGYSPERLVTIIRQ